MTDPETYDDALREIERLRAVVQSASDEIIRLRTVIANHTKSAAGLVVDNASVETFTIRDGLGMRTHVKVSPNLHDFYLAEPMGGWSDEHQHAFHKQVVRGFAEREAEAICESIWRAKPT